MDDASASGGKCRLALAASKGDSVSSRSGSELSKNISDVGLYGHLADEELLRDLSIPETLRDQGKDFLLSTR